MPDRRNAGSERTASTHPIVTMAALQPSFVVSPPRSSSSSAAFGGVIELSQLLMGSDQDTGPVVCIACRTINRASAKVCKGCDGRLPAFYAAVGGPAPPSPGTALPSAEPAPIPRVRALMTRFEPRLAPWSTVLGIGAALIAFHAMFGIWYAAHSASKRAAPQRQVALKAAPAPAAAVAPDPARTIDALNTTLHETAPEGPAVTPVRSAAIAPRTALHPATRPEPIERWAPASSEARPQAIRVRAGDPLAACRGLNLFARAVCMNNRCAQPGSAGHPQCVQVVQQRRTDEARRNPTMIN